MNQNVDIEIRQTSAASPWYWFHPVTDKGREVMGTEPQRCREDYYDMTAQDYRDRGAVVTFRR
jgi:hypothetical protein